MTLMKNLYEIAKLIYPSSARKRARFMFKSTVRGRRYVDGIAVLFEDSKLKPIIEANPKQYEKIFRPYLFSTLNLRDRLKYIEAHYDFTAKRWSEKLIKAVYVDRLFELAKMQFSDDENDFVKISLSREPSFANEGEIFIVASDGLGRMIFSLNFNFTKTDNGDGLFIGCMQGPAGENGKELVRDFTKKMQGLRPHHLMVFILQVIASFYGLNEIKAVSTQGHVYNANSKGKRIKTDYNGFWEEAGGEMGDDGFYILPLSEERKSMEEIKSNKRAMYRRRFEMMDGMAEQIKGALLQA